MELNKYKKRLGMTKFKLVPLKHAEKFKTPEYFSIFNNAVRIVKINFKKKINTSDYIYLTELFYNDSNFNKICSEYLKDENKYLKPTFKKINYNEPYSINNIKFNDLRIDESIKTKKSNTTIYLNMDSKLRIQLGVNFLEQFENPEIVKMLVKYISSNSKKFKNFNKEIFKEYLLKFYYDKSFNRLYKMYKKSGNKFIRPSLDHKIPFSKGGTSDLENLHFISFLENNAKNDMTWDDWLKVKKNIHKFMHI